MYRKDNFSFPQYRTINVTFVLRIFKIVQNAVIHMFRALVYQCFEAYEYDGTVSGKCDGMR